MNRLFKILNSEVNSLLDIWEKDLKDRKTKKTTDGRSYSTRKETYKTEYSKKQLQAFTDLELTPTKNKDLIKKQFKSQIKKYHPDKFQDPKKKKNANIITKRLNAAYELLYKNKSSQ